MSPDPSVVSAIEGLVRERPTEVALRLHLVSLLIQDGRADEAVGHCREALAREPFNVEALELTTFAEGMLGSIDAFE